MRTTLARFPALTELMLSDSSFGNDPLRDCNAFAAAKLEIPKHLSALGRAITVELSSPLPRKQ